MDIFSHTNHNPQLTETKFLNKIIQVTRLVSEMNNDESFVIANAIFCQFQKYISTPILIDTLVTIKGRCIGYDDLLEEIKLD